jgi:hypothetical protein
MVRSLAGASSPVSAFTLEQLRQNVDAEVIPEDKSGLNPANDPHAPEHNAKVAATVNYFLRAARPGSKNALENYKIAFSTLLEERNTGKVTVSQSLILRDAQRYLYGVLSPYLASDKDFRSTTEEVRHVREGFAPEGKSEVTNTGRAISMVWSPIYNAVKETAVDLGFESSIRTNPMRPASGVGGAFWYQLGSELSRPGGYKHLETDPQAPLLNTADLRRLDMLREAEAAAYEAALKHMPPM